MCEETVGLAAQRVSAGPNDRYDEPYSLIRQARTEQVIIRVAIDGPEGRKTQAIEEGDLNLRRRTTAIRREAKSSMSLSKADRFSGRTVFWLAIQRD